MRKLTYFTAFLAAFIVGALLNPSKASAETWKPICVVPSATVGNGTWQKINQARRSGRSVAGAWNQLGNCAPPPPPPTCTNGAPNYPTCTPDFDLSQIPDRFVSSAPTTDTFNAFVQLNWNNGSLTAFESTEAGVYTTRGWRLASPYANLALYQVRIVLLSQQMTNGGQTAYFAEDNYLNKYNPSSSSFTTGFSDAEIYGGPDGTGPPTGTTVVRTYGISFVKNTGGVFSKSFKVAVGPAACCVF